MVTVKIKYSESAYYCKLRNLQMEYHFLYENTYADSALFTCKVKCQVFLFILLHEGLEQEVKEC